MTTIEPATVTTYAHGLPEIILAVAAFAGEDEEWSDEKTALNGIVIDAQDGTLIMRATNRYTMAQATQACGGSLPHAVTVNARLLKDAAKALQSILGADDDYITPPEVAITLAEEVVTIAIESFSIAVHVDPRPWLVLDGEKDPLMLAGAGSGLDRTIGISHRWMRKISKIASESDPLRITFNGLGSPVLCEVGEWFTAAIMPIRLSEGLAARRTRVYQPRLLRPPVPEELVVSIPDDAGMVTQ